MPQELNLPTPAQVGGGTGGRVSGPEHAQKPQRPKTPRPLKAEQLWPKVLSPLCKLRDRWKKLNDPAMAEPLKQLEAMERCFWNLRQQRELAEAQAADKGEICWTVIHPRGPHFLYGRRRAIRTPRTITIDGEYWTIPGTPVINGLGSIWQDLEKEWHREPLDLAKFAAHAAKVDESYRKFLAKGGPEQEEAA